MKLRLIYSFYVKDDICNDEIYQLHYKLLDEYIHLFDEVIIVFSHNKKLGYDILCRLQCVFIGYHHKNLQFIIEDNDPNLREGIIYKKYVIDKLNDYDGLTFFAHTKGVSNNYGKEHLDNLKLWIFSMYYLNFNWLNEVKNYIGEFSTFGNKYCYGALYFKDERHNNIHNWFYSGSFQWINTKKLYKYIKDNNICIDQFISEENERLMRCAELFLGSILPEENCAFHNDEHFDKHTELFPFDGWEISYEHIIKLIKAYLNVGEYNNLMNEYSKLISN